MTDILPNETVIDLTTVARVNALKNAGNTNAATNYLIADREAIQAEISMVSMAARKSKLKRVFKKAEYTERFDIEGHGQRDFYVAAAPIWIATDVDTDITVYKNTDQPRSFTDSADEVEADYIICDPARQRKGIIHIEKTWQPAIDAVQITYTGGMATETVVSGTTGSTAGTQFSDANQTFSTKGIAAGDILAITEKDHADHGLHRIVSITSETSIEVADSLTDTTDVDYEIITGGNDTIAGLYPNVALAIDYQVKFQRANEGRLGIASESFGGGSITMTRPFSWLWYTSYNLEQEARR